jgi:hypothetical protein
MRRLLVTVVLLTGGLRLLAQEIPLEYRVKAAYLYNFLKYIDWPEGTTDPFTICVASRNPFGDVLGETVRGERVNGRAVTTKVVSDPDPSCHIVFVPRGIAAAPYVRMARGTLTVGEGTEFIDQGGAIAFVQEGANVRFQIHDEAAMRAGLRISSRLLRLARK